MTCPALQHVESHCSCSCLLGDDALELGVTVRHGRAGFITHASLVVVRTSQSSSPGPRVDRALQKHRKGLGATLQFGHVALGCAPATLCNGYNSVSVSQNSIAHGWGIHLCTMGVGVEEWESIHQGRLDAVRPSDRR